VLLQSFLVYLFMEWHWQAVTYRLSAATTHDIAMLIDVLENQPQFDPALLSDMARRNLNLVVQVQRGGTLPRRRKPRFYELLDTSLSKQLRNVIQRPFWIDSVGASRTVEIRIQLEGKILKVLVPISQTYASNSHIFLMWMIA
jgi:two-component system osmolarity sensor histidine kinase EnvZ